MNTNLNITTKNTWYEDYLDKFEESVQKKKEDYRSLQDKKVLYRSMLEITI